MTTPNPQSVCKHHDSKYGVCGLPQDDSIHHNDIYEYYHEFVAKPAESNPARTAGVIADALHNTDPTYRKTSEPTSLNAPAGEHQGVQPSASPRCAFYGCCNKLEHGEKYCIAHQYVPGAGKLRESAPQPVAGEKISPARQWIIDTEAFQPYDPDGIYPMRGIEIEMLLNKYGGKQVTPKLEEITAKISEICNYWHHANAQRDEQIAAILRPFITPAPKESQ